MEKVYPEQMKIEYESKEKAIISMYDGKENKKSVMIIYHIFNGLDLVHNKFNTYNAPETNQKLEREYNKEIIPEIYKKIVEKKENI